MCTVCIEWGGKRWHRYGTGYYERTDKSVRPKKTRHLHRERWLAECGPIAKGWHVHHRDGDNGNNDLGNLRVVNPAENTRRQQ